MDSKDISYEEVAIKEVSKLISSKKRNSYIIKKVKATFRLHKFIECFQYETPYYITLRSSTGDDFVILFLYNLIFIYLS